MRQRLAIGRGFQHQRVFQRKRTGFVSFDRRITAPRPAGREDHTGPALPLKETNDGADPLGIVVAHMEERGLAAAGDHDVVRPVLPKPRLDEFGIEIDPEGRLSKSVVGHDQDIGSLGQSKFAQAIEEETNFAIVIADRGARFRRTGADAVLECVGTQESMTQAIQCARPGSMIGYVGVPHGVQFDGQRLFFSQTGMLGGPAPVRRFLPHLMDLVLERKIDPGKVFDLALPLAEVAEGYRAMDERRAIKTLLRV